MARSRRSFAPRKGEAARKSARVAVRAVRRSHSLTETMTAARRPLRVMVCGDWRAWPRTSLKRALASATDQVGSWGMGISLVGQCDHRCHERAVPPVSRGSARPAIVWAGSVDGGDRRGDDFLHEPGVRLTQRVSLPEGGAFAEKGRGQRVIRRRHPRMRGRLAILARHGGRGASRGHGRRRGSGRRWLRRLSFAGYARSGYARCLGLRSR